MRVCPISPPRCMVISIRASHVHTDLCQRKHRRESSAPPPIRTRCVPHQHAFPLPPPTHIFLSQEGDVLILVTDGTNSQKSSKILKSRRKFSKVSGLSKSIVYRGRFRICSPWPQTAHILFLWGGELTLATDGTHSQQKGNSTLNSAFIYVYSICY